VTLMRLDSRWVDAAVMQAVVRTLGRVLSAWPDRQPILLIDCCPSHLREEVARTARACGIHLVLIPAKLTWLMQPCDTHLFQPYKAALRAQYCAERLAAQDSRVSPRTWWAAIVRHVGQYMASRSWSSMFRATGYEESQAGVSVYIKEQLGLETLPVIPSTRPSTESLQILAPRQRRVHWNLLLPRALPQVGRSAHPLAGPPAPAALPSVAPSEAALAPPSAAGERSASQDRPWRTPRASRLLPWTPLSPQTGVAEEEGPATATASAPSPLPPPPASLESASHGPDGPISARTRSRASASGSGN
jgi:hypothetical protein